MRDSQKPSTQTHKNGAHGANKIAKIVPVSFHRGLSPLLSPPAQIERGEKETNTRHEFQLDMILGFRRCRTKQPLEFAQDR